MTKLLVNEIFETIQGEGSFTGTPSIFVRLQGCPVGCPWCDTKHTWDINPKDEVSNEAIFIKSGDSPTFFTCQSNALLPLLMQQAYTAKHIVITGGEPCMFDLREFTNAAHEAGFSTQIETSATYEIRCHDDTWVTVSPKINMQGGLPILAQAIHRANEIKHPVAMQKHIDELDALLAANDVVPVHTTKTSTTDSSTRNPMIYLQPISQQKRATELAIKTCIERNWRLSVQLHKYIGVE